MLTPEERRGALLLLALLLIGAWWDVTRVPRERGTGETTPGREAGGEFRGVARDPRDRGVAAAPSGVSQPPESTSVRPSMGPLSLSRATVSELEALPGIGPVLARRIVEHRRQAGPFHSIDELRAVRGVGPRLLERLKGLVAP